MSEVNLPGRVNAWDAEDDPAGWAIPVSDMLKWAHGVVADYAIDQDATVVVQRIENLIAYLERPSQAAKRRLIDETLALFRSKQR